MRARGDLWDMLLHFRRWYVYSRAFRRRAKPDGRNGDLVWNLLRADRIESLPGSLAVAGQHPWNLQDEGFKAGRGRAFSSPRIRVVAHSGPAGQADIPWP